VLIVTVVLGGEQNRNRFELEFRILLAQKQAAIIFVVLIPSMLYICEVQPN